MATTDEFGGIAIDQPASQTDEFGGIPIQGSISTNPVSHGLSLVPDSFRNQIQKDQNKSILQKGYDAVANQLSDTKNAISAPFDALGRLSGATTGAIQTVLSQPSLEGKIKEAINQYGIGKQSVLQGLSDIIYNGINQVAQQGQNSIENPVLGSIPGPIGNIISQIYSPKNLSEKQIEQKYLDQLDNARIQGQNVAPPVFSNQTNPDISEPTQVLAPLIAGGAAFPEEAAAAIKSIPEAASNIVKSKIEQYQSALENRGGTLKPLSNSIENAFGITEASGLQDNIPQINRSIVEGNPNGITKETTPEQLMRNAMDFKINQYKQGLQAAQDQGMAHSTQSLIDAMQSNLEQLHTGSKSNIPQVIESVKEAYPDAFNTDYISPTEGQKIAVEINRDVNKLNPDRTPKSDAQLNAETALSKVLSDQGSDMYQAATGTSGTPNQDYGVLKQALGNADPAYKKRGFLGQLSNAQSGAPDVVKNNFSSSAKDLAVNTVKKLGGRSFIPTKSEGVVRDFTRVLSDGGVEAAQGAIDPNIQQSIIQKYKVPPQSPPPLPSSAIPQNPTTPDLTPFIQQSLKSMPSSPIGETIPVNPGEIVPPSYDVSTIPLTKELPLTSDIKLALKQLGIKTSNPKYAEVGRQLQQRASIIKNP